MSKKSIDKTHLAGTSIAILVLTVLASIPSCYSIKPGATQSGGKLYESFYLGEEGRLTSQELHSFVASDDNKIIVYENGKAYPYFPNRRTSKALAKINVKTQ